MDLNCETVLNVYTYKNRKILCRIKVESNSGKFKNCRCLSQEQWMEFDKNLEKLIATIDDWNNKKCFKFNINPCIVVKLQKSGLSLKHFNQCSGITSGLDEDLEEANYVLECIFDFKREYLFNDSIDYKKFVMPTETLECIPCSPLSYDPYTPSKKNYEANEVYTVKTPGIDFLECDKGTCKCSPKSVSGKVTNHTQSESRYATHCSKRYNRNENFSEAVIDTEHTTELWLNPSGSSKESDAAGCISSDEDRFLQVVSSKVSKAKGEKLEMNSQANNCTNIELRPNDENAKEHRYKRKKHKAEKIYSHYDNKITRKRLRTLDEFPEELSQKTNKIQQKDKTENAHKQPHKETDNPVENSSHSEQENKEISSSEEKSSTVKQLKILLTEAEAFSIKKIPKTPPIENDNSCESAIEVSPEKVCRRERKLKCCNKDTIVSLRRSERSPSKPKRFREEQFQLLSKSSKKHESYKNKALFGTDDDEDDLFETKKDKVSNGDKKIKSPNFETPVSKKPVERSSSSSSKRKQCKRSKSAECQQEKRDMSKWLCKRNPKPLDNDAKITRKCTSKSALSKPLPLKSSTNVKLRKVESDSKSCSKSVMSPPMTIELPSKEELELMRNKTSLMREENARIKAELDKMRTSPPKEVEILSLENVAEDNILSTFITYKAELDEIYRNNRNRDYIKGHDGINHCFIIRLLQQSMQMKMLEKLTEVYGYSSSTIQATLFANALLPEWVMRVYMEKFNFTRQEAIDQIKAQEAFQLHMEGQSENSFEFD